MSWRTFAVVALKGAERLLNDWDREVAKFWQVVPKEMLDRLEHPLTREAVAAGAAE